MYIHHTYRSFVLGAALVAACFCCCTLHEEPTLTASGEPGIDPTETTVNANIQMNITLGDSEGSTIAHAATDQYLHRFIVEAYLDRQPVQRQVVYENVTDRTHLSLPVSLKLHARDYQLVVWADYVRTDEAGDLYYNTESLVPVIPGQSSHVGNTEYKDVFTATQSLDLSRYRDEWGAEVTVDVDLERPVARYELVATDVRAFLARVAAGTIGGSRFTARLKYSDYLSVGYNALDGVLRHSLLYMQYQRTFSLPAEGTTELSLAFDYVFVPAGSDATMLPMELEIVDEENVTVANTVLRVPPPPPPPCFGRNTWTAAATPSTTPTT